MRKYKPYNISAGDARTTVHQIIIPMFLCTDVLNIAHDISGHLEVKKTYYKILAHFYWPEMKRDFSRYCRSCHLCQEKGKAGAGIKPYPLQPLPVSREPFSKVVIDCVGLPAVVQSDQGISRPDCVQKSFGFTAVQVQCTSSSESRVVERLHCTAETMKLDLLQGTPKARGPRGRGRFLCSELTPHLPTCRSRPCVRLRNRILTSPPPTIPGACP
ncbi:uncharacterized protein LOC134762286 [Penaeus indicus]|uniref:uncharacterized protein LOC134762286 n=1 Tax=Penaeus indicus TaxID=29960 RepID=UPI00300D5714